MKIAWADLVVTWKVFYLKSKLQQQEERTGTSAPPHALWQRWQACHNMLDNNKQEGWVKPEPGSGSCLCHAAHRNHTLEKRSAQQGTGTSLPLLNGLAVSQGTEFRGNKQASRTVGRFGNLFLQGMFTATLTFWDTSTAQKLSHSYQTTGATQDYACNSYRRCLFSPKKKSGITKENRTKERSLLAISLRQHQTLSISSTLTYYLSLI